MSQLVKAIMARDTGNRKLQESFSPLFKAVFNSQERIAESHTTSFETAKVYAKVYEIQVTLGMRTTVTESDALKNSDALPEAILRTKKAVIEACFGEFREDFYLIQAAIYDRDFQKARSLVTDLQIKMFEDM